MTREEYLMEKFAAKQQAYGASKKAFFENPSTERIDPFKIADRLYYVGDKMVCIHLIDSGDGLILIDSGFIGATHLLVNSIWRAGFDPKNVKWIIHSHGHSDHFGASDEFSIMYGTKLAISRADADAMRRNPELFVNKTRYPFAKIPEFDLEIEDGDVFELGDVKIRCVLTPGHSDGVLSLFFEVTDNGKKYLAGMFGGAGVNAITLPYIFRNKRSENSANDMLESIEKIWNEPVVVHLGNHPYNNHTLEKREKQLKEGGNHFIAPDSWKNYHGEMKEKIKKIIEDNEKMKKEFEQI